MRIVNRTRLFVLTFLSAAMLGVAALVYWQMGAVARLRQVEAIEALSGRAAASMKRSLEEVAHDVAFIATLEATRRVSSAALAGERSSEDLGALEDLFARLLATKPGYGQVRLLSAGEGGRELVRAHRRGGEVEVVAGAALQAKGHRGYFREALGREAGETYFSRIDLNRERGAIEVPHHPVLRVGRQVVSSEGEAVGLVVVNVDFWRFADRALMEEFGGYEHFLANEAGYYLYHADRERTFGFEFGRKDLRAPVDEPALAGFFQDASRVAETLRDRGGELMRAQRLRLFGNGPSLILGVSGGEVDLTASKRLLWSMVGTVAAGFLAVGFVLARYLTRGVTGPLARIALASERLAKREPDAGLPLERQDEIGDLARSFQRMREAVDEHQEKLARMNERLVATNEDLDHFAHIASHELREPLARISGLAQLLRLEAGSDSGDDLTELAEKLQEESGLALSQITDFRVYAGISEGQLLREEVELRDVVEEVLAELGALASSRAETRWEYEALPRVSAYASLVKALYRNLVENALKYGKGDPLRVRFTAERREGVWTLGVWNSGSEIAEEDARRIFLPMVRLDRETEGTGFGLSICKKVVDRHQGALWVESGETGTHFKFTLGNDENGKGA